MNDCTVQRPDIIGIHCRSMEYTFDSDIPRYWANNNPVITAFYNALSSVIPEGERFFIKSVRDAGEVSGNDILKSDIRGFIEQEASHSISHRSFNQWVASKGYPIKSSLSYVTGLFAFINKHFSIKHRLAITCAIEHFSSVMSDRFLRYPAIHAGLDKSVREFLMWHCAEEIEHKAVAYDLYQSLYGGYFTRIFQMLFITLFFVPSVFGVQFKYLRQDKQLFNIKAWWQAVIHFWFTPGWFGRIPSGYVKYFSRNFHPWDEDNSDIVQQWIASSKPA